VRLVNGLSYDLAGIFVLRRPMNFVCGKWLAPVHSRNSTCATVSGFTPHAFLHLLRCKLFSPAARRGFWQICKRTSLYSLRGLSRSLSEEINAFAELYTHDVRPLQHLNGRVVKESQ
jgi:hypothetical protein